ncbi:MAG: hypothetical protein M3Y67_05440, partial [Pseudomonadota bacterium]|nr:hypothetical protein [Pseudomonadota bacterium]
ALPRSWRDFLGRARSETLEETREIGQQNQQQRRRDRESQAGPDRRSWKPALWIAPALAAIVVGSIGLVRSATALGQGWLPHAVLGTFVLASLTGLPNALTAVRLARSGRGTAVITETFNSNSINILVGLLLPAMIVGQAAPGGLVILDLCWLVLMTVTAVVLSAHASMLTRRQGIALIALYLLFTGIWALLFLSA